MSSENTVSVSSTGTGELLDLAARLGIRPEALSEERWRDLLGRVRAGDVDGSAVLVAAERKRAEQLVRAYNEREAGVKERKVLRTLDARRLGKEVLALFSERAASDLARTGLSLRGPTLRRETIESRLEDVSKGLEILRELKRRGRSEELRSALAGVAIGPPPPPLAKKPQPGGRSSDTLDYFSSRKKAVRVVSSILSSFREVSSLTSFLDPVASGAALQEVVKTVEEYEGKRSQGAEAALSDAEVVINERLRSGGVDGERARMIVEEQISEVVSALGMNSEEENGLRRAALEGLSIPFEFERTGRRRAIERWEGRQAEERAARLARTESLLAKHWSEVEEAVQRAVSLDQALAVASAMEEYGLAIPTIGDLGTAFLEGRNPVLLRKSSEGGGGGVKPVSYSLGRTSKTKVAGAKPRNVVMLTGANSGGKTTLLTTLASIHILTLFGLPVPCSEAEVAVMPVYLFRRRVTRKIGSLEQALGSLIPVFAEKRRKLVLMDEFEALTEPGAAGRILAGIINFAATGNSLLLLVTHLARETLPHVRLPIRVDGIEAEGLDKGTELIVDRLQLFVHIGSSSPKLIIMKLAKGAKKSDKALYEDILSSLEEAHAPVQAPISVPWLPEDSGG